MDQRDYAKLLWPCAERGEARASSGSRSEMARQSMSARPEQVVWHQHHVFLSCASTHPCRVESLIQLCCALGLSEIAAELADIPSYSRDGHVVYQL